MLNIENRKEIIKSLSKEIKELKKEIKDTQRKGQYRGSDQCSLITKKEKFRYFNMAHTLIKKFKKDENILEKTGSELFDAIKWFGIENNWKRNSEDYSFHSKYSIDFNYLKIEIEGICNGKN